MIRDSLPLLDAVGMPGTLHLEFQIGNVAILLME
jgi:hypothetical protein